MTRPRPRVLFVAEAVTLAHVARPLALAAQLPCVEYEVVFASEPRFGEPWKNRGHIHHRPIRSIPSAQFLAALRDGRPVYDASTLKSYLADDLRVIREVKPDAIVGDFRLTLAIASRLACVPYLAITNAYWSPYAEQSYPMPEFPLSRALGVRMASPIYHLARPIAFALHSRPLDRLRVANGLPSLGFDLRRAYTDADRTLYADVPELVPTVDLPPHHHYLGPVEWSMPVPLPDWWDDLPFDRPIVYATPGSSGGGTLLGRILEGLAGLPLTVIAASAGHHPAGPIPANARVAPYLPGWVAAAHARLVLCNGGSPTTHQALAAGVPVIGVAENLDQHLNMAAIVRAGLGLLVRSEWARPRAIREAAERILAEPSYGENARGLAAIFARYDAPTRFRAILDEVLETPNQPPGPGQ